VWPYIIKRGRGKFEIAQSKGRVTFIGPKTGRKTFLVERRGKKGTQSRTAGKKT